MAKKNKANSKLKKVNIQDTKLFQNLFKVAHQFITGKSYNPLTEEELRARLGFPEQHTPLFREVLDSLVKQGLIELKVNRYVSKKDNAEVVSGVLRVHPRGFGFLQADTPHKFPEDVFIPKHLTLNAVDGDRVEVIVNEIVSEKGPEGRVVTILSRAKTHISGIINKIHPNGDVLAYVPLLGPSSRVLVQHQEDTPLRIGDRIVMHVIDWGSKETETIGGFERYIGHISNPSCDISAAIEEFEIRTEFPPKVVEEAKKLGKQVRRDEINEREDLREIECFTVDPDTAKDYDDALSLTKDSHGYYHLGVHIADVSHYVKPNSALDQEAKLRCNSTYFPRFCVPMLPGALSENLCSLRANVNRLTVSVLIKFDTEGNILDYKICRSVIKSAKRFTYREAKLVLDGRKRSQHAPTLHMMVELCFLLKKKRYERGSIEFALPEFIVKVDEEGVPQGIECVTYDITHQLVEEFMLKANEMVALHLTNQGKNLTYRIHEEPAEENLRDFSILAGAFGFHLPEKPTPGDLQKLFDEALATPYGQYLATSYIRRMRLAVYSADNIGHYGLGLSHYCHFTSPIRRYIDLVVHRILFGESDDREHLEEIAQTCSDRERISAKAENTVNLLKKLRLLKSIHEKDPFHQHDAIVTRVKNYGFFFEIFELMVEGFLHVSELDNDFFIYEESRMRLRGRRYGKSYCLGDRITVMLKDIDLIGLESSWYLVSQEEKTDKKIEEVSLHKSKPKKNTRHPPSKKQKEIKLLKSKATKKKRS